MSFSNAFDYSPQEKKDFVIQTSNLEIVNGEGFRSGWVQTLF